MASGGGDWRTPGWGQQQSQDLASLGAVLG